MLEESPLCGVVLRTYPQLAFPPFLKGGRGDFKFCSNTNPPISPFPKGDTGSCHIHGQALSFYLGLIPIILCLCLLTLASPALAHRVLVYAYTEGDTIHIESKFVGSGAVQQGQVQILDQKTAKVLLTGTTDDQGKFSFKIPSEAAAQRLDLLVVVEASMGHRGEWQMKAQSYLAGAETAANAAAPVAPGPAAVEAPTSEAPATPTPPAPSDTRAPALDRQMLEETLNKVLERQLAPMKEMLAESQVHKTTLTDIIGGIGYIMGIFGLLAYFQSKKKNNP